MAIPVWTPGEVLVAADVNTWFVPSVAAKTSDQSVTSSTTLVSDSALFLPVATSALYIFNCLILNTGLTGGQIKMQFTGPAGATMNSGIIGFASAGGNTFGATFRGFASTVIFDTPTSETPILWQGSIQTSSTAGTVQFQWAQGTSNATATVVKAGSYLSMVRSG